MRPLAHLIFAVSFMFGQIVAASPQEDAEYIAERIIEEGGPRSVFQQISNTYAHIFTRELNAHSIKVIDAKRFAEMLPANLIQPWIKRSKVLCVDQLLKANTPDQIAKISSGLDVLLAKPHTLQAYEEGDMSMGLTVAFSAFGAVIKVGREIEQSMPKLNETPYLADILETDGIFRFPNRIWRKDFIAKIRSGM